MTILKTRVMSFHPADLLMIVTGTLGLLAASITAFYKSCNFWITLTKDCHGSQQGLWLLLYRKRSVELLMFGWIGVALFALVSGCLALMMRRERMHHNSLTTPKRKPSAQKKQYRSVPDKFSWWRCPMGRQAVFEDAQDLMSPWVPWAISELHWTRRMSTSST